MEENFELVSKEEQIEEAKRRKKLLVKMYNVNSEKLDVVDKYREDGFYGKIIKEFEEVNHCYVYHCLVTYNIILNMLYVGNNKEEWDYEGPAEDGDNSVLAYTYNESTNWKETGYIILDSRDGEIIRVG